MLGRHSCLLALTVWGCLLPAVILQQLTNTCVLSSGCLGPIAARSTARNLSAAVTSSCALGVGCLGPTTACSDPSMAVTSICVYGVGCLGPTAACSDPSAAVTVTSSCELGVGFLGPTAARGGPLSRRARAAVTSSCLVVVAWAKCCLWQSFSGRHQQLSTWCWLLGANRCL